MQTSYTLEQKKMMDKEVYSVCDQLFNIARKNNQRINTVAYNPGSEDEMGTMFKMLWGSVVKGVYVDGAASWYKPFVEKIDKNDCNVLVVHEKILNAEPSVKMFSAKDVDLSKFGIKYIKYVIVVRDDARISNNVTSHALSCRVDDWADGKERKYTSIKEIIAQQMK